MSEVCNKCMDNNDHADECEYIADKLLTHENYRFAAACVREKAVVIRTLESENARLRKAIKAAPRPKGITVTDMEAFDCWKSKTLGETE